MANPRTPAAKAKATGAAALHPGRHAARREPVAAKLGSAPTHLTAYGKRAWAMFLNELPWLTAGDGALLEVASRVRGEMMAGDEVGVTKLSMYQSVLSKLGATPTDRSKVTMGDVEEEPDEFFGPN
jgi:hypothetical protein